MLRDSEVELVWELLCTFLVLLAIPLLLSGLLPVFSGRTLTRLGGFPCSLHILVLEFLEKSGNLFWYTFLHRLCTGLGLGKCVLGVQTWYICSIR